MKEIGGYLELDRLIGKEYYPDLIAVNTARNAFVYLCRAKKIEKVFLPYFLCDSVVNVCERENIRYDFYHINADFTPQFSQRLGNNEWLYLVNYYGQLSAEQILGYQKKYKNIILDNVQAFFEAPLKGVDTIYSCRKFFGVPDGAYLATDAERLCLETDYSMARMKHVLGRYEGTSASDYYQDFKQNDASFKQLPLLSMSKLTHNLLGAIDYHAVISKRESNWVFLHGALANKNRICLKRPIAPYMYPFYCGNGMKIKTMLAQSKIFVPTLWPNVLSMTGTLEQDYAENILPLPCDQRYDQEDMTRIVEAILECSN